MAFNRLIALPHQGTNGGGRGVESIYLMLIDDLPKPTAVGPGGDALKHERCRAVRERAVDDIGVTGDPAHIGRTPVDIAIAIIKNVLVGHRREGEIAAARMQHAFGLAG